MPNKTFLDVVFEETKTKDRDPIQLDEGLIPFTPFIAYSAFKKKIFNSFKNNKLFTSFRKIKEEGEEGARAEKGKALTAREKLRATFGASSGGTVYKLTKQQIDVMAEMYNKYGSALVKEIIQFRRKVLAPYELIKRIIKKSSRVSSKDVTGVSKEEFTSALESGKKKIAGRGEYAQNVEGLSAKLNRASERISALEELKQKFNRVNARGVYDIDYNIVNKVMRKFGIEEAPEGYSVAEIKKVANEITRNAKAAIKDVEAGKLPSKESIERRIELGKISMDLTKKYKGEFFKGGSFNAALGKMFFSHEIYNQLMNPNLNKPGAPNIFRQTYVSILNEMIAQEMDLKKRTLHDLIELKKGTEFSDKESKVWGKRPGIVHKSGKEEDYYQKVKEEDFLKRPIVIARSEELIKAEQKIENEIKKFELKLRTIMDKEDYEKLKKYRVIGNLITVKELKNSEDLFKSKEELEQYSKSTPEEKPEEEKKETPQSNPLEEIKEFGKSIINKEYEDSTELGHDVNKLRNLINDFKDKDPDAEEKMKSLSGLLSSIDNKISTVKGE